MRTERRSPIRIHSLRIQDFRGIKSLSMDFKGQDAKPPGQVFFVGANATGKTTILEALARLLGEGRMREGLGVPTNPLQEMLRFGAHDFQLRARFSIHRSGMSVPEMGDLQLNHDRWLEYEGHTPRSSEHIGYLSGAASQGMMIAGLRPQVQWFKASTALEVDSIADLEEKLVAAFTRRVLAKRPVAPGGDPFARVEQAWQHFERHDAHFDVIQESNNPGSRYRVVLRGDKPIPQDITSVSMARELAASRSDVPDLVTFDQLSAGQRLLFSYIGPLIFRDLPAEIVLIDEADRHLHPAWAMRLVPALRKVVPDAQFFVATHSPQVLSDVENGKVFVLKREDDGITARTEPVFYGRESNLILEALFGVPSRPSWAKEAFHDIYVALDEKRIEDAKVLTTALKEKIGADDPEFGRVDLIIRRREGSSRA
jgi:hypothetical protein